MSLTTDNWQFVINIITEFQEGNTCVAFNSSSRYLLTGGKGKTLNIWDMKTKSIKKTYKVGEIIDNRPSLGCIRNISSNQI